MLIFDASKNKKLQMTIESSGIENDKLRFVFTVDTGSVQYGFPCQFNEGKVEVDIPPLDGIIKNLKAGTYNARLDVTGDDKYYLNPFNESIQIKQAPTIKKVDLKESSDMTEDIKIAVSGLFESDGKGDEPVIDKEEKPKDKAEKTGISKFFDK